MSDERDDVEVCEDCSTNGDGCRLHGEAFRAARAAIYSDPQRVLRLMRLMFNLPEEPEPSEAEQRSSLLDTVCGAILEAAERRYGVIDHWDVKAETEDGLEVVVWAERGCAMFAGAWNTEVRLLWVEPAGEGIRLVAVRPEPVPAADEEPAVRTLLQVFVRFVIDASTLHDAEKLLDVWIPQSDDRLVSFEVIDNAHPGRG